MGNIENKIGERFLTGSKYFFGKINGFKSHDMDFIEIWDKDRFGFKKDYKNKIDVFYYPDFPKEKLIEMVLEDVEKPTRICTFLIKEYIATLDNFTIDDLKQLRPLRDELGKKYEYLKVIYDFYLENNDFTLTNEQLLIAYNKYLGL